MLRSLQDALPGHTMMVSTAKQDISMSALVLCLKCTYVKRGSFKSMTAAEFIKLKRKCRPLSDKPPVCTRFFALGWMQFVCWAGCVNGVLYSVMGHGAMCKQAQTQTLLPPPNKHTHTDFSSFSFDSTHFLTGPMTRTNPGSHVISQDCSLEAQTGCGIVPQPALQATP